MAWIVGLFLSFLSVSCFGAPLHWQEKSGSEDIELPVVVMKINGHEVRAFFDTGADGILIGDKAAQRLGIFPGNPKAKSTGQFAGGKSSETIKAEPVTLSVDGHEFANFPIKVVRGADASPWRDVTVGVELLRRARILMDYRAKTLTVLDQPLLEKNKKAVELPFEFVKETHLMIVRVKLNGKDANLHFDTGGTFALNVLSPEAKELKLEVERKVKEGRGGGGQEVTQIFYKQQVDVCLKGICESAKPIAVEGQDEMFATVAKLYGQPIAGQVSHRFFAGKKVEYDIPHNKIWILAE